MLKRLLIIWLVCVPLGLYFGFPYFTAYLQEKTRGEAYTQCIEQTAAQPEVFDPSNPAIANQYCECVRDGLTLTRDDMMQIIRKQPPEGMQQRLDAQMNSCNQRLSRPADTDAQLIHF